MSKSPFNGPETRAAFRNVFGDPRPLQFDWFRSAPVYLSFVSVLLTLLERLRSDQSRGFDAFSCPAVFYTPATEVSLYIEFSTSRRAREGGLSCRRRYNRLLRYRP